MALPTDSGGAGRGFELGEPFVCGERPASASPLPGRCAMPSELMDGLDVVLDLDVVGVSPLFDATKQAAITVAVAHEHTIRELGH